MTSIDDSLARTFEAAAVRFTELQVLDAATRFVSAYRDHGHDETEFALLAIATDSMSAERSGDGAR